MIRFVDLREQGTDGRFAFYSTVDMRFMEWYGQQTWYDFAEWEQAAHGDVHFDTCRSLMPAWALVPMTREDVYRERDINGYVGPRTEEA